MDANMSTTLKIAAWKSWRPAEYFQEYYGHRVEPDEQADDWSRFTEYALNCEGVKAPSREDLLARERQTRGVLSELLLTDARKRRPLGPGRVASYDLLTSSFCMDSLSRSKSVWRRCMRNVFESLKPGGSFVILSLRGCEAYRVGAHWFPGANIQSSDLESSLIESAASLFNGKQ